jgi:hypothetical protein
MYCIRNFYAPTIFEENRKSYIKKEEIGSGMSKYSI